MAMKRMFWEGAAGACDKAVSKPEATSNRRRVISKGERNVALSSRLQTPFVGRGCWKLDFGLALEKTLLILFGSVMRRLSIILFCLGLCLWPPGTEAGDGLPPVHRGIGPTVDAMDWQSPGFFSSAGSSLGIAAEGAWRQFTYPSSLMTLGLGAGAVWLADTHDQRGWEALEDNSFFTSDVVSSLGDEMSIVLGFTPLVTYYLARWRKDEKLHRFSVETFASLSLAWAETIVLSQIDYHVRPKDEGHEPATGFFDTALRGKSSWPSGHLIAPFTLTFKTWDYYGWKAAVLPAGLTVLAAGNRIADGSHYPSDIVGAGVLSLAAHFATKNIMIRRQPVHVSLAPLKGGLWVSAGCRF
jgi:membrane-associated phospholipid phosphatase